MSVCVLDGKIYMFATTQRDGPISNLILFAGNPEPNITWTKDGATPSRVLGSVRYGRWSLILEDLVVSDSGNYSCIVCNLCGCISFTFKVDIVGMFVYFMQLTILKKKNLWFSDMP